MTDRDRPQGVDRLTYAESYAAQDGKIEGLEKRIERRIDDAEGRIIKRLDDQDRSSERLLDRSNDRIGKLEERIRDAEKEITTLKAADAMLWRCFGAAVVVAPLIAAAIQYLKR